MAGTQASKVPVIDQSRGVDLRTSEGLREDGYLSAMVNCVYAPSNIIKKRKGFKAVATGAGAYGVGKLNRYNEDDGTISAEMLSIGPGGLLKANDTTLSISYSGSNTCFVYMYYSPAQGAYYLKIVEGATTKIDQALGLGFDEASTYSVSTLATAITAISGGLFSATATGSTGISAALLGLANGTILRSSSPVSLIAKYWSAVYAPVADMMAWFHDNRNSDALTICVPVNYRRSLFFPNPTSGFGMMKYDGHAFYRAGVPSVNSLVVGEVAGASAAAEVTSVTTRASDAVAQVETVLVNSNDTGVYETFTVTFQSGNSNGFRAKYILTADAAGGVAIWFNLGSDSEPSHGQPRSIEVDFSGTGSDATLRAAALSSAVDADSQFSATSSGGVCTIVNTAAGARTDASIGTAPNSYCAVATTQQGSSGYGGKYFDIYESASSRVSVWLNSGSDTQPSTGAARYIAVPYTGGNTATQVATAIKNAVDADGSFAASVVSATVTITHSSGGAHGDIGAGDSTFTVAETTAGVDSLSGKYFKTFDTSGSVAWWFSFGGAAEPAHGCTRSVDCSGITAGMTADQVATALEVHTEADAQYTSTVSTNVVVMTDAATGARTDATAETSGFTISVTTQGGAAGIGTGSYSYKTTVIHRDFNGVVIEGNPSDAKSVTLSGADKDALLTIGGIQPSSGFNTGCAIVNGNQTSVTAITVDSGHTIQSGDLVYLKSGSSYVDRTVSGTTSTTITVTEAVTVADNAVISAGLKIGIYRTKVGGFDYFLVAEIPNNSLAATFTYQDAAIDSSLTAQYLTPVVDRSPPGSFKSLAISRGVGIATGFLSDPDIFAYSDIDSLEYWPADTNLGAVTTERGDRCNAVIANNETALIGKTDFDDVGGSIHAIGGTLDEFATYSIDTRSISVGISSRAGSVEISPGVFALASSAGIYAQLGSSLPTSLSDRINSALVAPDGTLSSVKFNRVTAVNDTANERCIFFFPVEPDSGTKYATSDSMVWVFDYSRGFDGQPANRWYQWTGVNAAGGLLALGEDIYFIERRFSSYTETVQTNLYKFHSTNSAQDFEDHSRAIAARVRFGWKHGGDPSSEKDFLAIKMINTNQPDSDFTVGVSIDYDFVDGGTVTQDTITVTTDLDDDAIIPLSKHRAFAIRPEFTNSSHHTDWSIEGFDLQIIQPAPGSMVR